jgi:hypothetical protein
MDLKALQVLHWHGSRPPSSAGHAAAPCDFVIDTCQRRIAVSVCTDADSRAAVDRDAERFEGVAAYDFLLRVCCGLESRLLAETEIFCQMKQSWARFALERSPLLPLLSPWMQHLFQDVKEIRAEYLCKLGSSSYGSQVRRLLEGGGRTLLVGAGQLAQTVAPWLAGSEILLWNRTVARSHALQEVLQSREPGTVFRVVDPGQESELAAWRDARQVVVCIPPDPLADPARIAAWRQGTQARGRIIHLGAGATDAAPWRGTPEVIGLDAVFETLHQQTNARRRQVSRSRAACTEKAILRGLHEHTLASHSWEDLAVFH